MTFGLVDGFDCLDVLGVLKVYCCRFVTVGCYLLWMAFGLVCLCYFVLQVCVVFRSVAWFACVMFGFEFVIMVYIVDGFCVLLLLAV